MGNKGKKARVGKKAWFGVKSLFRIETAGEPRVIDEDYDPEGTLIEERVVLVRARSADEALKQGEAEANAYCGGSHVNPYGQRVAYRRVRILGCFSLFDSPGNMREVWSSMTVVSSATTDQELEDQRFGTRRIGGGAAPAQEVPQPRVFRRRRAVAHRIDPARQR